MPDPYDDSDDGATFLAVVAVVSTITLLRVVPLLWGSAAEDAAPAS